MWKSWPPTATPLRSSTAHAGPLDIDTILQSVQTGRLLIVDENFAPCGIGAEIAAQVVDKGFDDLDVSIMRLNGAHTPTPYSPTLRGRLCCR
ncbi:MAG: transketolase C-terminal domain-containing protein [Caldilineaceae bacterium]